MPETPMSRQFWIETPGSGRIVERSLPPSEEGEVLIQAVYSGISRGTESLVFRGEVPPSQYDAMKAPFQDGAFPGPLKYGYASVGKIVSEGESAGREVLCLYPHQDLYRVSEDSVIPLPDGVPPERAVLAPNLETAVNAVWDGRPTIGDRIVVIGGGVVGFQIAWLCNGIPGVRLTLVDRNPARRLVADALGIPFAAEPLRDGAADLVFHTSGNPSGLADALGVAGTEATVVEVSWYGSRSVPLPLGEAFHSRRLTIRGSQVGRIPPDRQPRWNRRSRLRLALDLLANSDLDVLISSEIDFEELPRTMERISRSSEELCVRVRYPNPTHDRPIA